MAQSVSAYIAARARAMGLDPKAVIAVARQEGLGGGVGDHGTSFGPFQLHEGGALPSGIPLNRAQAWAESPAGINYALSRIKGVAGGLRGAQAVQAIVSRFERPANIAGEVAGAMRDYGAGGSSPALAVSQLIAGSGNPSGVGAGGMSPQQMMSMYLLQQAQSELGGQGGDSSGLLALAMARKALAGSQGAAPSVGGAVRGSAGPVSYGKSGGFAGGFLPKGAKYVRGRLDQGQDGQTNPGAPILAPGNGVVISVKSDPNGFGPAYPIVHFNSGPYAGKNVYLGHTLATVRPGERFRAGQVLSHTGTTPIGNASVPGWFEIGFAPGGMPGPDGQPVPF